MASATHGDESGLKPLKTKALLLDGGGLGGGVAAEVKMSKEGRRSPLVPPFHRRSAHHHPGPPPSRRREVSYPRPLNVASSQSALGSGGAAWMRPHPLIPAKAGTQVVRSCWVERF